MAYTPNINLEIHKYRLEIEDSQFLELPIGFQILHIGEQAEKLFIWVQVVPGNITTKKEIVIKGTGYRYMYSDNLVHLQTVVMTNGFVWHIFERFYTGE